MPGPCLAHQVLNGLTTSIVKQGASGSSSPTFGSLTLCQVLSAERQRKITALRASQLGERATAHGLQV